jgi:phosphoribosylformylglycinamidine synthase PurS subunit
MPHEALLDPQGKAVSNSMKSVGLPEIEGVRIGRHVRLFVEAASTEEADAKVEAACKKILCNQIMETYTYQIHQD